MSCIFGQCNLFGQCTVTSLVNVTPGTPPEDGCTTTRAGLRCLLVFYISMNHEARSLLERT